MMRRHRDAPEAAYTFCGDRYICAYCRDPADTIDHTVPIWFVAGNDRLMARYRLVKVAACVQCNTFAGMKVDATFTGRRKRIATKLRRRERKLLQTADWPPEEIAELGPMLRVVVSNCSERARAVLQRLRHLDSPVPPDGVPDDLLIRKGRLMMGEEMADAAD